MSTEDGSETDAEAGAGDDPEDLPPSEIGVGDGREKPLHVVTASGKEIDHDEVYLRRQTIDNRTVYSRYDDADAYVGTWSFWLGTVALDLGPEIDLQSTLEGFETRVADRSPAGRVHLVGTAVRSEGFVDNPAEVERVENATLHAFVARSGFVESYHVVYDATLDDGERVRVRRSVRFERVGTTTVDRPSWYDEAMERG